MIQQVYIYILVAFITLLSFLGLYLILGRCPDELKKSSYSWSRKATGLAFVWLAIEIVLFAVFDIRSNNLVLSSALNLITYYIFALFMSAAFIRLLDEEVTMSRAKIMHELAMWGIYSLCLIFFAFEGSVATKKIVLAVGAILCFIKFLDLFIKVLKVYNNAVERSKNYHSENIEPIIRWMNKSTYMLFVLCITSLLTAFTPKLFIIINVAFAICVIFYVFINYINVMVCFSAIEIRNVSNDDVGLIPHEEETSSDEDCILKPEVANIIKVEIDRWISEQGYVKPGVSIKTLAAIAGTNRTYMSQYINSVYRLPFRDWIIQLRVSYAKAIMLEQPKLTAAVVSQKVGFSSAATFTRAFTRLESIPPVKWRDKNIEMIAKGDEELPSIINEK